jgi:transcriptional regulator with XRE-family HTH domain
MNPVPTVTSRLATHLHNLRLDRGWTLDQLAKTSGVSRGTLSRIEQGEVSPTTETLAKLSTAFGLAMSRLLSQVEDRFDPVIRHKDQSVWLDPATGFRRRAVSPLAPGLNAEVLACEIPPNQILTYDAAPKPDLEHHLILQSGRLELTVADESHDLKPGDCLRYVLTSSSQFKTGPEGAHYLLVLL